MYMAYSRRLSGTRRRQLNGSWGALLPDGFELGEWQVLAGAAIQSLTCGRRIVVVSVHYATTVDPGPSYPI